MSSVLRLAIQTGYNNLGVIVMLGADLLDKINALVDEGDNFLNSDDFSTALGRYQQAASMIPEPKYRFDIALPVFTAIGEAYYYSGRLAQALDAFRMAVQAPGGIENPLTHLRLGQTYYELGDFDKSADELTRAYMLDGAKIFEGEDEKYQSFLSQRIVR
jgi:tetratricopeptide (TPR) repeat protein